jgi:predicted ferric reductase
MLDASQEVTPPRFRAALGRLLGRPADWQLRRPRVRRPEPGLAWVGPSAIAVSIGASWFAFDGAVGEDGNASFALFVGATSIMLMAWSFVLAIRLKWLEPLFGGLDRMYRVHRWCGALAVGAMFLHTSSDPELEQGIRGASKSVADAAEGLAGIAEIALYVLVAISVLRWFPYRYWRWTSAWGWWFGIFMIVGLAAWIVRVVGRDMLVTGVRYRIESAERIGSTLDLKLAPVADPLRFASGQFAVIKVQRRALSEPHIFTIAASPSDRELRFFIRDLGDWTNKMQSADLVGIDVIIEGPYGTFEPTGDGAPTVWFAGGVGITPFLSAAASLEPRPGQQPPVLFYSVTERDDAMALAVLEQAHDDGVLELVLLASAEGNRFTADVLHDRFGPNGLENAHVAVCGPAGLVAAVERAARSLGSPRVEREDFDIRQGFGPDLSTDVEQLLHAARSSRAR